jgi:RNA polymerase sigma-70 factor (ECF subfamily)
VTTPDAGGDAGNQQDRRLHAGLLARKEAAITELYERYAPLVRGVAARLVRDPAAAEDVVQEVFVQVWTRPEAYDPGAGPLPGWLAMLARRRAVDAVRRAARQRRRAEARAGLVAAPDPAEAAVDAVLTDRLRAAVRALPEPQRVAVLLAYAGGLTGREIAARLGIPEGTAKSRLRLGLRRIARQLAANGFGTEE